MHSSAPSSVRATVVQAASFAFDVEAGVARAAELGSRAAGGAPVVVFPEGFLGSHPERADFGATDGPTRETPA